MKKSILTISLCMLLIVGSFGSQAAVPKATSTNSHPKADTVTIRSEPNPIPKRILKVPAEFPSIAKAVKAAKDGDWVIISPGKYYESRIEINQGITVSSEWKLEGDTTKIKATIIDSDDEILFTIN